nr:TIGR00730 family Rossman fold protein [Acidobacteriota bacterium]
MEITRICVYCGASATRDPAVETEIRTFGREIARRGIALVYGGSSLGLMGALADEVLGAGGKVIGVIPKTLVGREAAHKGLTELKVVETMHEREQVMSDMGDAFVA